MVERIIYRKLERDEMAVAALVHRAAFDDRLPWLIGLHTHEEDRGFYENVIFEKCEVWGALYDAKIVGLIAFRQGWIDQLYILPAFQHIGIGSELLRTVKLQNNELQLCTFQKNLLARSFYEKHGFKAVEFKDGSANEEREPDVRYCWTRL